ncbi:MAG: hypothetical protein CL931_10060 [Deltaproteobacteria bacterium]|nr:hypothetical protein [Deltaproteobacteria bacterium]
MDPKRAKLEQLQRWKQAADWSPLVWLPLVVYWALTARASQAIGLAIAGAVFIAFARFVVGNARCPGCETRFRDMPAGFSRIWNELACEACGLSLFELRRGRARD